MTISVETFFLGGEEIRGNIVAYIKRVFFQPSPFPLCCAGPLGQGGEHKEQGRGDGPPVQRVQGPPGEHQPQGPSDHRSPCSPCCPGSVLSS